MRGRRWRSNIAPPAPSTIMLVLTLLLLSLICLLLALVDRCSARGRQRWCRTRAAPRAARLRQRPLRPLAPLLVKLGCRFRLDAPQALISVLAATGVAHVGHLPLLSGTGAEWGTGWDGDGAGGRAAIWHAEGRPSDGLATCASSKQPMRDHSSKAALAASNSC